MKQHAFLPPSVTADPAVCHGRPVIAGSRVMVWQILELLEFGEKKDGVYAAFPSLPRGAVEAALRYAAAQTKNERYVGFSHHDTTPAIFA